ncbi:MAG: hypothetical protein QOJ61_3670, partial [Mycobacterium sp.]|nr:hypothetical protein [Mycobacterium sp.]
SWCFERFVEFGDRWLPFDGADTHLRATRVVDYLCFCGVPAPTAANSARTRSMAATAAGSSGSKPVRTQNFQNVIARRYWQLPGGAGSGTGGCGQLPCLTHCTTTKELVPDVPRCVACQYEPSG